ncbi:triacylglycerol lipase [Streptomyces sp. BR123]|uniref:esterase/lipase family protein n=1 Tax=Streptomyces sp. BR123 TaxID=2749828 RepID=UPI00211B23AD|nr:lipase [Streptomyces sp. BR123]
MLTPRRNPTALLTLRAALCAVVCAAFGTVLLAPLPAAHAAAASAVPPHRPVVLVHGHNADPGVRGSLRTDLRAAGYTDAELFSWGYDTHRSVNEVLAGQLGAYVDRVRRQTGAERVDVVSHSFGSLVSRWYATHGGGTATVDRWVSLAGPHHGTATAWACSLWDRACRDMSRTRTRCGT